ncbi:MAG TPA: hypothetical protein VFQ86_02670, partial [Arachidicoccus soli]|nr:hypothetical protein [Arachidicoccus soli]
LTLNWIRCLIYLNIANYLIKFVNILQLMDSKQKIKNTQSTKVFIFLQKLGTPSGLISSILGLIVIGASGGYFLNNIIKNTEILDLKTKYAIDKIQRQEEISDIKDEVRNLKDSVFFYKKIYNGQKEGK